GNLWSTGSPFTKFDVKAGKFTGEFMDAPDTYGVAKAPDGNMWFAVTGRGGAIGYVDQKTGKVSRWPTPGGEGQRIQVDSDGIVWFTGRTRKTIGSFDPKTQMFKEWALPGPSPSPYPIVIDKNHYVWYNSDDQDEVGRLDPKTGQVMEYPFP